MEKAPFAADDSLGPIERSSRGDRHRRRHVADVQAHFFERSTDEPDGRHRLGLRVSTASSSRTAQLSREDFPKARQTSASR